jgi:hypothetical protein
MHNAAHWLKVSYRPSTNLLRPREPNALAASVIYYLLASTASAEPDLNYNGTTPVAALTARTQGRRPEPPINQENYMAQNHYTSKSKRRPKNSKRKDYSAATMAKVRKLEAADKTK